MTGLLHPFEKNTLDAMRRRRLVHVGPVLGVAVSGGPDSVALLHVLHALQPFLSIQALIVLHYDHGLRGEDSAADRRFVEELAGRLGCEVIVGGGDVRGFQRDHRMSLEMAARLCRRAFYMEVMRRRDLHRLALGHTADDQAEEVLLRLCRGTGPGGLRGMQVETAEGFLRPLLWASRAEVLQYLSDTGRSFREDATNLEGFCQRNRVRHEVLPLLEKIFHPRVRQVLCRHADLAAEDDEYWARQVAEAWGRVVLAEGSDVVVFNALGMQALHRALSSRLFRQALKKIGFSTGIFAVHLQALEGLLQEAPSGRQVILPAGGRAFREGFTVVLTKRGEEPPVGESREMFGPGRYPLPEFRAEIAIQELAGQKVRIGEADPWTVLMDAHAVLWPLKVRTVRPGDRFRPLGGPGSKKLQDFFTDAKVPRTARRRIPLLCDGEKICWVVGYRLDDRVKVRDGSRTVLHIQWRPLG
ncbi:tRNA lysidine(34) synthetase TilS [Desulfosoma sp.]